jgi:hypothetical protein
MGRPPKVVNGQPTARPKPTKEELGFLTLVSAGVVAWALSVEMLIALEKKGVFTDRRCRRIIAGAADALQAMEDGEDDPIIKVAISLLDGQLAGWNRATKPR